MSSFQGYDCLGLIACYWHDLDDEGQVDASSSAWTWLGMRLWGLVAHTCIGHLNINGSGNDLLSDGA